MSDTKNIKVGKNIELTKIEQDEKNLVYQSHNAVKDRLTVSNATIFAFFLEIKDEAV